MQAQNAPDFTVTDTDGTTHKLYEDYLDQGTTVVLKFFFVDCPPCNSIAPHVQGLYEDWGEGAYDVQFMELTVRSRDDDNDVAGYKTRHSLTFPGISEDGGAADAVSPFVSGQFGDFRGTPSFAVIAPSGEVNYGTGGLGNSGKIENLNEAIEETGAMGNPNSGGNNLPSVYALNVTDAFGQPRSDLQVFLGDETDLSLAYPISLNNLSITNLTEEYPGVIDPVLRYSVAEGAASKVNALDLLDLKKHILNIRVITDPSLQMAADTDGDGLLTALDMLTMRKLILNILNDFPQANHRFIPEELPLQLAPGQTQNLNIEVIKVGDLDGN